MAKNSIGQFLAALRKANGLTQQEVADRLNVSNKAVSRWERDECCPDLSLIPALAEMFAVTCDELLRGERSAPGDASCEEKTERQKARADKQFAVLLRSRMRKYKNLTLLPVGLAICGLLAAAVADLAFSKGLIAFILAAAFGAAGEICQICFARNSFILSDGETEEHAAEIQRAASEVVETAVRVTFLNIALIAFCLPTAVLIDGANFGLTFESWLLYGLLFSGAALALAYIAYTLFVRGHLMRLGLLTYSDEERETLKRNRRLLVKTAAVSLGVAAVLWAGAAAFYNMVPTEVLAKKEVFYTCEDFKAYVESAYDAWFADFTGTCVTPPEPDLWASIQPEGSEYKVTDEIKNKSGEVICSYYYNPNQYYSIQFSDSQDRTPITVVTEDAFEKVWELKYRVETAIYGLIVLDFVAAAGIYLLKTARKKSN